MSLCAASLPSSTARRTGHEMRANFLNPTTGGLIEDGRNASTVKRTHNTRHVRRWPRERRGAPSTETEDGPKGADIGLYSLKLDNLDYSVTLEQLKDCSANTGRSVTSTCPGTTTRSDRGLRVRPLQGPHRRGGANQFVRLVRGPHASPARPNPFCIRRRRVQKQTQTHPPSSINRTRSRSSTRRN